MSRFMLDTDTCSYIVRRSDERVLRRLSHTPVGDVCISVITKAELLYGVAISPRRRTDAIAVSAFLHHLDVQDFPDEAAQDYAEIRADLRSRGLMIGANDLLIAAHARASGATLITNNVREFERVRGLTIDNWAR